MANSRGIIASKLNRPIEFSNMKFMALIPALQSGKIDMIVTGMTATKERKKFVDFSEPYFENAQVMLVRKSDTRTLARATRIQLTARWFRRRTSKTRGSAYSRVPHTTRTR